MQIRLWITLPEETPELVKALTDKLTHKLKLPLDLLNMPICQQIEAHLLFCHSTKILASFSCISLLWERDAARILDVFSAWPEKMFQV